MASSETLFEIYTALRGRLTRLVVGIVPPRDVEDIVQGTYVRVCQIENKDAIRQPQSFMFRTAQNLALNHIKRAESRFISGVDNVDELGSPRDGPLEDQTYAQVASDERFALFCEAVRHLPQQCRRAYVLKKVYGYTLREIAGEMNLSATTTNNAEKLGLQEEIGPLEVGKVADFLVLEENPLEDILNTLSLRYTVQGGVVYDSTAAERIDVSTIAISAQTANDSDASQAKTGTNN